MRDIKVVVIDDSAFMRKMIFDILQSDEQIEVVATARNGLEGLKKIEKFSPNVVTLDVEMPKMDGIMTLTEIMSRHPLPVVMLASTSNEGTTDKTIQAMDRGAVDFIRKPSGQISLDINTIKAEIIAKVKAASQINIPVYSQVKHAKEFNIQLPARYHHTIVAIGTSTGGPRALQTVLSNLPDTFIPPILIVQHMPPKFTKSLAERLNSTSKITVKEAEQGELILPKTAYIAPGDFHMTVVKRDSQYVIDLTKEPPCNGHRPSVDILFHSVKKMENRNKVAVILTGMGNDGAHGMKMMKQLDNNTITVAESERTSIVYGMPKAAKQTNMVDYIYDLEDIAPALTNMIENLGGK